jgi:hypothetical protein
MSSSNLALPDRLTCRRVPLALVADGKWLTPAQLRAQIKRPLEIMKVAAWFYARQSPGIKRQREEPPPPLGHMLGQFSPCVPVRVMCGCVATACRRLATAPAGVHVVYRTTGRWAAWIMERVTRGRVRRVQVRLQRRACAYASHVFDACCSKRWLIFRCLPAHRSARIKRTTDLHSRVQAAAAARVAGGPDILKSAENGDGAAVLCHLIADANSVNMNLSMPGAS